MDRFWDLRDDAFDNPDRWHGVAANILFSEVSLRLSRLRKNVASRSSGVASRSA